MKPRFQPCLPPVALAMVLLAMPQSLLACAACFGKSDDAMAKGMNMGIFTLLIFISLVLVGIAGVGIFFARRSARLGSDANRAAHTAALHAEFSKSISQPTQ